MQTVKFAMTVSPDGEISVSTDRVGRIASKIVAEFLKKKTLMLPGGMIVMSTDVNAEVGKGFLSWAKGFMKTWFNRFMKNRMVDEEIEKMVIDRGLETGWSVGNLFRGRFISPKSGESFTEKSFAIDIRGVPFDFVEKAAETLRRKFKQESVLLVNHANNKTFYLD